MNNGFFEGGFRRIPEQNLAGASSHSGRGDFLRKIHYLRSNRQVLLFSFFLNFCKQMYSPCFIVFYCHKT